MTWQIGFVSAQPMDGGGPEARDQAFEQAEKELATLAREII